MFYYLSNPIVITVSHDLLEWNSIRLSKKKEIYRKKNRPNKHKKLMKIIFRKTTFAFPLPKIQIPKEGKFPKYISLNRKAFPASDHISGFTHFFFYIIIFFIISFYTKKTTKTNIQKKKKKSQDLFFFSISLTLPFFHLFFRKITYISKKNKKPTYIV